ncbi:MAG: hypothetical protein IPF50_00535 [Proteobacteria bacterium]|nr:hypothetical protein [Pseudomonadota bacterium]
MSKMTINNTVRIPSNQGYSRTAIEGIYRNEDCVVTAPTRIYVRDMAQWEAIGRAHGEVLGNVRPASAMVEVSALVDPAMLVEIEADAYVTAADT